MSHLTMDQLLELREPGREPGQAAAREHLAACPTCQAEADALGQRIARLRALPEPRPARDLFAGIRARHVAERRRRRIAWGGAGALALAASVALAVVLRPADAGRAEIPVQVGGAAPVEGTNDELAGMMARSRQLEDLLRRYDPDNRAIDGRTAAIAARLEEQLGSLDRQIELMGAVGRVTLDGQTRRLQLWRERVGLLDALMDVHLTRASYAGL